MSEFEYEFFDPFQDVEQFIDREAEEAAKYDTIHQWVEAGVYTAEQGEEMFRHWLEGR